MQLKHKKRFVWCMEKVLWPIERVKVVCRVSWYCWHFGQIILCCGAVFCIGRCSIAPWPLPTRSQQQEIADILKISKSIKLLVTMENVSFILWKKPYGLYSQPNRLPFTKHFLTSFTLSTLEKDAFVFSIFFSHQPSFGRRSPKEWEWWRLP